MSVGDIGRGIADKEWGDVYRQPQRLDLCNGCINLLLRLVIHGVGVVAHKAVGHHRKQAVCTEKLGKVFPCRYATVLIET